MMLRAIYIDGWLAWMRPDGSIMPPIAGGQINDPLPGPQGAGNTTAQIDGAGRPYVVKDGKLIWLDGGTAPFVPVQQPLTPAQRLAEATAPRTSISSGTSSQNPAQFAASLEAEWARIANAIVQTQQALDTATANREENARQFNQSRLDSLLQAQHTLTYNYAQLTQNGNIAAAHDALVASEGAAGRAAQAAEGTAGRTFAAGESAAGRQFTAGESALSRAQQAGQFLADYNIKRAQQSAQENRDKLAAATTFSTLSGSPDLTGFSRFLEAGGGNVGNAILRGGTSLTPGGQLGAARALQAAEAPRTQLPDYMLPQSGGIAAGSYGGVATGGLPAEVQAAIARSIASPAGANYTSSSDPAVQQQIDAGRLAAGVGSIQAGQGATFAPSPNQPTAQTIAAALQAAPPAAGPFPAGARMAYGTFGMLPRYALGTRRNLLGHMQQQPQENDPNAGIPPMYATGTFEAGDSTDPSNPAAGGAHPEMINLEDPPGANNARATVQPLTPPGVGDTTGGNSDTTEMLSALLVAIANFLSAAHEQGEPPQADVGESEPRMALGTVRGGGRYGRGMMPFGAQGAMRYALGTDPTTLLGAGGMESDQPYVNRVMAMRQQTPYSVNPFAANYQMTSPTQRAIGAAGFQTATGVPGSELDYVSNLYQPGGLARGSHYMREQQLGV